MPLHVIPRNWTKKAHDCEDADAILVSIPKSGRTWLRFGIRHYLCGVAGVPFSIDPDEAEPRGLPRLACSHDLWEHLTAPRLRDRVRGKYLIPPRVRRTRKILLAVRDLRDVMVSLFLQLTRRGFRSGARYDGSLSEMIRDPRFGAERTAEILDYWLREWRATGRLHVWRYEQAKKDPRAELMAVLDFLGLHRIDDALLDQTLAFASFENMKRMESENRFGRRMLQPGDPLDPESFKVRRGVVGGYRDYLSDEDVHRIDAAAARLRL